MKHTEVVVHIDESLDNEGIYGLEKDLAQHDGVYSACVSEGRRHLMLVDYDPDDTKSFDILSQIRGSGLHASLIGF